MRSSDPHRCACRATYFTTGEGEPGHPKESPEKGMKPSSDHSEEPRTLRAHSILHRSSCPLNVTSEISLSSAWPWPRVTSQKTQGALATLVLLDPWHGLPPAATQVTALELTMPGEVMEPPWAPHRALKGGGQRTHLPHWCVLHLQATVLPAYPWLASAPPPHCQSLPTPQASQRLLPAGLPLRRPPGHPAVLAAPIPLLPALRLTLPCRSRLSSLEHPK